MGTWGPGNLSSDGALDVLYDQSVKLIEETLELAASKSAAEFDEYDYDVLFVKLETIFALDRSHLLSHCPEPDVVTSLKHSYLAAWDAYVKKNKAEWDERRAVIAKTFDRFIWICQKEQSRKDSGPTWVEITPPTIEELAPEVAFMPHLIFDDLHLSLPTSWSAKFWSDFKHLPQSALTRQLTAEDSGRFMVAKCQYSMERGFYATGESLVPDEVSQGDEPYIFLARLKVVSEESPTSIYSLVCDTMKQLEPGYQAAGQHVSGVLGLNTLDKFNFDWFEAFRHVKPGPDWGTKIRTQHLYYHPLSEHAILLLEFGSIRDNVNWHFPDKVLLDHIVQSLRSPNG